MMNSGFWLPRDTELWLCGLSGPLNLFNIAAFLGQGCEMWTDAFLCPSHPEKGHSRKSRGSQVAILTSGCVTLIKEYSVS